MLNLTLAVNGKPVEDLSFTAGVPPAVAASSPEEDAEVTPVAPAPEAAEPTREYRAVPVATLGRYLNHQVRLYERGQKPREGTLLEVANGNAVIERQYSGGSMSHKMPLAAIARAEVWF